MNKPTIIVVDDDQTSNEWVKKDLLSQEFEIELIHDSTNVPRQCQLMKPALIIICSAVNSSRDVIEIIGIIRSSDKATPIILIARHSSETLAIQALKLGVNDYIKWPFDYDLLLNSIRSMLAITHGTKENSQHTSNEVRISDHNIIGNSPVIKKIKHYLKKVAIVDSTVLITGQTGTGKECVARQIHEYSLRRDNPMICINCAALPDNLLESELFGFERGAFTGATTSYLGKLKLAEGGTIFFDEIGDMSLYAQAKILRIFENKEITPLRGKKNTSVDIRIISATNHDLKQLVAQHQFREDLYYRTNVISIELPALKDRKEDIPLLARYYLKIFAEKFNKNIYTFSNDALQGMLGYDWPGNIRELKNVIEAIVVNQIQPTITAKNLPPMLRECANLLTERLTEKEQLLAALSSTNWNKSKAAEKLNWSRMTVYRKMVKYGIVPGRRIHDNLFNPDYPVAQVSNGSL